VVTGESDDVAAATSLVSVGDGLCVSN